MFCKTNQIMCGAHASLPHVMLSQSNELEEEQEQQWKGDHTRYILPEQNAAHFCLPILLQRCNCLHIDGRGGCMALRAPGISHAFTHGLTIWTPRYKDMGKSTQVSHR